MVPDLGSGAAFFGPGCRLELASSNLIPGDQAVQIVTVRAVGAECVFIEQPLDSATQADLIGVVLSTHWPAHIAVPATPEEYNACACQSCS